MLMHLQDQVTSSSPLLPSFLSFSPFFGSPSIKVSSLFYTILLLLFPPSTCRFRSVVLILVPINPSLKSLGVIVRLIRLKSTIQSTPEHSMPWQQLYLRYLQAFFVLFLLNTYPLLRNNLEYCSSWQTIPFVLNLAKPRRGSGRISFLPLLAQTLLEVFTLSYLFNVLRLGPWPNIYIDMGSLTFHPHNYFFSTIQTFCFLVNNNTYQNTHEKCNK